jgi:hypothetical protein
LPPRIRFHAASLVQNLGASFASGPRISSTNHPNFGSPISYLSDTAQFGYATQMLNHYLGSRGQSGGLNPLYQIGGSRSIQLALKLQF